MEIEQEIARFLFYCAIEIPLQLTKKDYSLPISIIIGAAFIAGAWIYSARFGLPPSLADLAATAVLGFKKTPGAI